MDIQADTSCRVGKGDIVVPVMKGTPLTISKVPFDLNVGRNLNVCLY